MEHRPRKRFGQNFLQDSRVIDNIIDAFNPETNDNVLEIGPGLGALTHPLLSTLNALTAIEIDRDLQANLKTLPSATDKLTLIAADALRIDYNQFGKDLRIIGNLPYNISTPLVIHLLHFVDHIKDMHFMFQKEVAERLAAFPGNKDYGRLSIITQYYCDVEILLDVPAEAFYPKPKVESAVLRLTPYLISPYPALPFASLERLLARAFSMRRKTLANNLKPLINAAEISAIGINPALRPEQVSIMEYVQLAKLITQ